MGWVYYHTTISSLECFYWNYHGASVTRKSMVSSKSIGQCKYNVLQNILVLTTKVKGFEFNLNTSYTLYVCTWRHYVLFGAIFVDSKFYFTVIQYSILSYFTISRSVFTVLFSLVWAMTEEYIDKSTKMVSKPSMRATECWRVFVDEISSENYRHILNLTGSRSCGKRNHKHSSRNRSRRYITTKIIKS